MHRELIGFEDESQAYATHIDAFIAFSLVSRRNRNIWIRRPRSTLVKAGCCVCAYRLACSKPWALLQKSART